MKVTRRSLNALIAGAPLAAGWTASQAAERKDSVIVGMILEPPGLDPTTAPAAAIGEIVHYNIFEGLTRVGVDGAVTPLLAESWAITPDGKSYTFRLRKGIKFSDGAPFDAAAVKFSFDRARAPGSTNKANRPTATSKGKSKPRHKKKKRDARVGRSMTTGMAPLSPARTPPRMGQSVHACHF